MQFSNDITFTLYFVLTCYILLKLINPYPITKTCSLQLCMQAAMATAARGERCGLIDTGAAFSPRRAAALYPRCAAASAAPDGVGAALGRMQACVRFCK